jgi:hypothetical protein
MIYKVSNKQSAHRVAELINALSPDKQWSVEVKEWKPQRTPTQNATMWAWYTIIGNHLGYTKNEMHDILREEFLPVRCAEFKGREVHLLTSTSGKDWTVDKEAAYLSQIERFAATELGIILPRRDDPLLAEFISKGSA